MIVGLYAKYTLFLSLKYNQQDATLSRSIYFYVGCDGVPTQLVLLLYSRNSGCFNGFGELRIMYATEAPLKSNYRLGN
jgi:hypothetical protein